MSSSGCLLRVQCAVHLVGFTLDQVLRAIFLYERKSPTHRSPKTLRNLVCSYTCRQEVTDDDVTKILDLTKTEDPGVREAAFLLMRQLCACPQNASKFLSRDSMQRALNVLEDATLQHLHEVAAQVVGKLACHVSLGELWIDYMMTCGLDIIKLRMSRKNPQHIQYACAQCLVPLATHRNLAILLLDQATDVISEMKDINSDFKEVYAEIMTVLAEHTDYTRVSILDINSLTEALIMLKEGPCASQKQALVLVATLAESECGLKALLEEQTFHYILSALQDSECRRVRCSALAALHNALATPRAAFQKQVLVSADQFFHEHEEGYGLTAMLDTDRAGDRPRFRLDTESRLTRAVEDLCDMIIKMVHKDARLTKTATSQVVGVQLSPGIDVDPTLLLTLTHLAQVMFQIGHLKVNTLTFKGFDLDGINGEEYSRIMRKSFGGMNPVMVQILVNRGATCVLDILHAYVMKFHIETRTPLSFPIPDPSKDPSAKARTFQAAWSDMKNGNPVQVPCNSAAIFSAAELKLISALLEVAHMLAMCSCDNDLCDIEQEVRDKMVETEGNQIAEKMKQDKDDCNHMCNGTTQSARRKNTVGSPCRRDSNSFFEEGNGFLTKRQLTVHRPCGCNTMGSRSRPQGHLRELMDRKATIQREASVGKMEEENEEGEVVSEAGLLFKDHLNKELGKVRRKVRLALYQGGIIETVGPWLACSDASIKGIVFATLRCLIQHLLEFVQPCPAVPEVQQHGKKIRPMSAMTPKERERALNIALFQMSSHMNSVIKNALGMPLSSPPSSPRKPATQPPTPAIFTIEERCADPHPIITLAPPSEKQTVSDDVSATALELGSELFYDDDDDDDADDDGGGGGDKGDDLDGVTSGFSSGRGWVQNIPDSTRQCLTIPQQANVKCDKGAALAKIDNLKTYSHDDYHRFARRQSKSQCATPTPGRPGSTTKLTLTSRRRPQSAKATVLSASRPDSTKAIAPKRPQSASVIKPTPQRQQSDKLALSEKTQPRQAAATVSQRYSMDGVPDSHLHPKPPVDTKRRPSQNTAKGTVCVRSTRSEVGRSFTQPSASIKATSPYLISPRPTLQPSRQPAPQAVTQPASCGKLGSNVKVKVTASMRPGSGRPLTIIGARPISPTSRGRSATSSSRASQKALMAVTKGMKHGQVAWKPAFDKCQPVRAQCCHRVVDVCGRILIRDLVNRDVTVRRAAIVFLQEVIKQSERSVHMKLSECSLVPRLVDFLRINDDNVLEEVLGLMVTRLLVQSDQRLKQLFSRCGGTELLMALASSSAGFLHSEVASTLKAITKANGFPSGTMGHRSRHRIIMSAPVGRNLAPDAPDIWDKIMDRWKEEDKVTALLRKNNHR